MIDPHKILTISSKRTFDTCPRCWVYRYVLNLAPKETAEALVRGTEFHEGAEATHSGGDSDKINTAKRLAYDKWVKQYDDLRISNTENAMLVPLDALYIYAYGPNATRPFTYGRYYGGVLDAIAVAKNGSMWVLDHKTVERFYPVSSLFSLEQLAMYCVAFEILHKAEPEGGIVSRVKQLEAHPEHILNHTLKELTKQSVYITKTITKYILDQCIKYNITNTRGGYNGVQETVRMDEAGARSMENAHDKRDHSSGGMVRRRRKLQAKSAGLVGDGAGVPFPKGPLSADENEDMVRRQCESNKGDGIIGDMARDNLGNHRSQGQRIPNDDLSVPLPTPKGTGKSSVRIRLNPRGLKLGVTEYDEYGSMIQSVRDMRGQLIHVQRHYYPLTRIEKQEIVKDFLRYTEIVITSAAGVAEQGQDRENFGRRSPGMYCNNCPFRFASEEERRTGKPLGSCIRPEDFVIVAPHSELTSKLPGYYSENSK